MSLKKNYLNVRKLNCGPGGWYCQCCNPYHCHPAKMKPLARRLVRRTVTKKILVDEF